MPARAARVARPVLLVLAGVNGAGKSSIGGHHMLRRAGLAWFNPDTYTRLLVQAKVPPAVGSARAWQHGVDLLDQAVAAGHSHAFETTLGGTTITRRIAVASRSHDVLIWYCGLSSVEQHIARVALRVAAGGHDIPADRIRERWVHAPLNLIELMPVVQELKVYDNSVNVEPGGAVPDPRLLLHMQAGKMAYPHAISDLMRTPDWAKAIVQAARQMAAG